MTLSVLCLVINHERVIAQCMKAVRPECINRGPLVANHCIKHENSVQLTHPLYVAVISPMFGAEHLGPSLKTAHPKLQSKTKQ